VRNRSFLSAGILMLAVLVACLARAEESPAGQGHVFHVSYAEPLHVSAFDLRADSSAARSATSRTLSFTAFGRQFDLELQPNTTLTSRLGKMDRDRLAGIDLYKGRIAGLPGSWVRLSTVDGLFVGAIWDGNDLYALEQSRVLAPHLDAPAEDASVGTLIYRLSDTRMDSELGCVVVDPGAGVTSSATLAQGRTGLDNYKAIVGELRQALAAVPEEQIEIALLGDKELSDAFGANAATEMMARLNVADGIFSEQVDVAIVVGLLRVFTENLDPFSAFDAGSLLEELSRYREQTPDVRDRGLAHLLTGRDLSGLIIGVAYLDALCETQFGVSLAEATSFGSALSGLIVAHELGHNFGAPHDNQAGSACAATPQGFLMNPFLDGSNRFSDCSLAQMAPSIQTAACIVPSSLADVTVEMPTPTITALTTDFVPFPIDVRSVGTSTATNVRVNATVTPFLAIETATVPNGTCLIANPGNSVSCQLGDLDASVVRRVTLGLRSSTANTFTIGANVIAANDRGSTNNSATGQLIVNAGSDLRLRLEPTQPSGFARQPLTFDVVANALGPRDSENVVVDLQMGPTLQSVVPQAGSCNQITTRRSTCSLGPIVAGGSVRMTLTVLANRAGPFSNFVFASSTSNGQAGNTSMSFNLQFAPTADISIQASTTTIQATPGQQVTLSFTARSSGPDPAQNAVVTLSPSATNFIEAVDAPQATCTQVFTLWNCAYASIEAGGTRRLDVRVRSAEVSNYSVIARTQSDNNDDSNNDQVSTSVLVKHVNDIRLQQTSAPVRPETMSFDTGVVVDAVGHQASGNISVRITLPQSIDALSASVTNGACTTSASIVQCSLPTLAADRSAFFRVTARGNQPGAFTAQVESSADNDGNTANNTGSFQITIIPIVDVSAVALAPQVFARPGEAYDATFEVRTGIRPVAGVQARVNTGSTLHHVLSVTPSVGTCSMVTSIEFDCILGDMAASSSVRLDVRARHDSTGSSSLRATGLAVGDVNTLNNGASTQVITQNVADPFIEMPSALINGRVGQELTLPVTLRTFQGFPPVNIVLTATLPTQLTVLQATMPGANCSTQSNVVTCTLPQMNAEAAITAQIRTQPQSQGTFAGRITVALPNDSNPANNELNLQFVIDPAPTPPPPPPPPGNSDGGGGGGSMGWWALSVLAGLRMAAVARRRRERTRTLH